MPILSLSPKDLSNYDKQLVQLSSTKDKFELIREIYKRVSVNETELEKLEFAVNLLQVQSNYDLQKEALRKQHQKLKDIRQTIDDRILVVEQKLYLGIPEDLDEMERLITEQEAIVADQEKLNDDELSLLESMSQIDVAFGKQLAEIDQSRSNRDLPLKAKLERQLLQVEETEKKIQLQSKLYSFLPILIIPIILDYLAYRLGLNGTKQIIFSHYIFLVSFLGIQIFFADTIIQKIGNYLANKQADVFLKQISDEVNQLDKAKRQIENKHGIKAEDVVALDMNY
ncbi:hypothetical protein OQZ33_16410 [Pedobacter sp. MC2016-05]|uniref:hypothetical protein n=1 Tax=Pedobacter sp. MC2016-05 TaxID=2994474 RepID=UPI00224827B9|nr:hypothetical protein [Pedobacter sp. MC2016-05]MCX2475917.1 hypothetical protein [Pedobacter sp. MC2016-05]